MPNKLSYLCTALILMLSLGILFPACWDAPCNTPDPTPVEGENPTPEEGETPTPEEGETPTPEEGETPDPEEGEDDPDAPKPILYYTYNVVAQYPHDPQAFTQGLQYVDGFLYEGTGLNGRSTLRKVALETGEVLQKIDLAREYFGEGITVMGEKIYQLTWQHKKGFVYEKDTFELITEFSYPTEGWGLTHDGTQLIMSDGTANLYFIDPVSLTRIGSVVVSGDAGPISRLNELEYIKGEVYANVWQTHNILIINPRTGRVNGVIDLKNLLPQEARTGREDVLNGIAYDAAMDRLFVTGKNWSLLFEVDIVPVK